MNQIDNAWNSYLTKRKIKLDGQVYRVDAKDIKKITHVEPRILAKFDNKKQLPRPLADKGYVLFPITNGQYALAPGDPFCKVIPVESSVVIAPQTPFQLITLGRNSGESGFLDTAFIYGILSDFTQVDPLYLTIRGRERVGDFTFRIEKHELAVSGVQIEVDGGFEGRDQIVLVEAKVGKKTEFNIRQLYYPMRHFHQIFPNKKIRTVFMEYDFIGSMYCFYEYSFAEENNILSGELLRAQGYLLAEQEHLLVDEFIDSGFGHQSNIVPQADDLNKVFELVILLGSSMEDTKAISDYYAFTYRQGSYYTEACDYLGLVERSLRRGATLTINGDIVAKALPKEQQILFAKSIINSWIFEKLIILGKKKGGFDRDDIDFVISSCKDDEGKQRYNETTVTRRRQTIIAWIRWLNERFGFFEESESIFTLK